MQRRVAGRGLVVLLVATILAGMSLIVLGPGHVVAGRSQVYLHPRLRFGDHLVGRLVVQNPSGRAATVSLHSYGEDGTDQGERPALAVEARGRQAFGVDDGALPPDAAAVTVISDVPLVTQVVVTSGAGAAYEVLPPATVSTLIGLPLEGFPDPTGVSVTISNAGTSE